ncbi:MAG: hypothetical protein ABFC80_04600 [Coriobacteriales bacterium]|nr:hypothetical protein [Actinomycetes bacterium]
MDAAENGVGVSRPIGSLERTWLGLVFGGPVQLWVALARLVGVQVAKGATVDDELLADAEAGAMLAARWFPWGLAATAVSLAGIAIWSPVETRLMSAAADVGFDVIFTATDSRGVPWGFALWLASAGPVLLGGMVGILNACVFGGIPLYLLRRSASAAAPAVSVALAQREGDTAAPEAERYPRVHYAVDCVLHGRSRRVSTPSVRA